jgi:hypothetical protein
LRRPFSRLRFELVSSAGSRCTGLVCGLALQGGITGSQSFLTLLDRSGIAALRCTFGIALLVK